MPVAFAASLCNGALRRVAGSYGSQTATGAHTVSTTALAGDNTRPAVAIAAAASGESSKHSNTDMAPPLGRRVAPTLRPVAFSLGLHFGQARVVVGKLVQVRPRDLPGGDRIIVADVGGG